MEHTQKSRNYMAQNYPDSVELHETPETRRYRICGVVQGVGFRPFVHRLARTYGATGWVLNDSAGIRHGYCQNLGQTGDRGTTTGKNHQYAGS